LLHIVDIVQQIVQRHGPHLVLIGLLLSVLALTQTGSIVPLVATAVLAFLCIRHGGVSMLDFLRYAAAFFFFGQQYYEWRERV
jgi:hypothetical protein